MLLKDLTDRFRIQPADAISGEKARKLIAAIAQRDAEIERFRQQVLEQESRIEALQQELDQARFRTETLERSYATQLQCARDRAETAEKFAQEREPRIKELEISHKLLQRKLDDAQARLDMFSSTTASIDELLAGCSDDKHQPQRIESEAIATTTEPDSLEDMLDPSIMFVRKDK